MPRRGDVVGIDLVEVAPAYDPSGITAILAAQVLLNFLGYVFHERKQGAAAAGQMLTIVRPSGRRNNREN